MTTTPPPPRNPLSRRRLMGTGLAVAGALGLAACGVVEPVPRDHFYRLQVVPPAGVADGRPPAEGAALVPPFDAGGVLNQRALLWTRGGLQLQQYSYHFWTDSPAKLFQEALVATLRAADSFERVATPPFRQRPDWLINGALEHLELIGGSGEDSAVQSARVRLTLKVSDADDERLLLERSYEETVPVPNGTVAQGAAAVGTATEAILLRFLRDLAGLDFRKNDRFGRR